MGIGQQRFLPNACGRAAVPPNARNNRSVVFTLVKHGGPGQVASSLAYDLPDDSMTDLEILLSDEPLATCKLSNFVKAGDTAQEATANRFDL